MGSSSCGARALLPCGVWDLPRTGIEPCPLPWQADSEPLDHQGSLQPLLLWQVTLCALVLSSVKWEDNNFWYRAVMNIQFSSVTQSCPTLCNPWTAARQASLSITNYRSLLKLMSIESVIPSNHRFLCRPLLLLPSIFPRIRVFSKYCWTLIIHQALSQAQVSLRKALSQKLSVKDHLLPSNCRS